jgi:signal transduction histidine kinase
VSQVIALYFANAAESGDTNVASSIGMASFVIQIFTVFGFFLMTCRWLLASRHAAATVSQRPPPVESFAGIKRAASGSQPQERGDVPFTLEQFILDSQAGKIAVAYPLLYTLLSLGVFLGIMIFLLVYTFNYNWVAGDFVGINLAIVAIEFLLVVYTVRKSKSDVLQALNAVKEGKKIFVRYIAHEIRTPLNTAFLGLKIVIDDLKEKEEISAGDKERLDTCEDVYKAVLHAGGSVGGDGRGAWWKERLSFQLPIHHISSPPFSLFS